MDASQFVPWRQISSWACTGCGECCQKYGVVLKFHEWLRITQSFGADKTIVGLDKLFIKRAYNGDCAFLCHAGGNRLCGLQRMKPDACKLWPFKVLPEPRYGNARQAAYDYFGKQLYVYADCNCNGLRYGNPTWTFGAQTLKEFVGVALGTCRVQRNTTRSSRGYGRRLGV
ncbi:MAG: YkgJ family cysteine cluster protein [Candidatus Bathyarchaeota archaeon]|nr:YkgJ family cysteine cluster protein [Candidatus Bathyarchaeota archaeon]